MIYLLWSAIIFLTLIIQGSLSLFDITPNLTVILVYYAGIRKGETKGLLIGSLIGILEDSLSGIFLGPNLLSKGLIGYFSSFIYRKFFIWTPIIGILSIFILTFIDGATVLMLRGFFDKMPVSIHSAIFILTIQSLLNTPLGIFLKPKEAP
jgi:rod shape-determining protein MreD